MKNANFIKALASVLAVCTLAGCGGTADKNDSKASVQTEQSQNTGKNKTMPQFVAKDLDGNTVTNDVFAGKDLTVINIWGTFCTPCIGEMPELGEWSREMPENMQIIGLIIDIEGEADTEHINAAKEIIETAEVDFTQIIANNNFDKILSDVVGVPTTIFVDKNGNIVGEPMVGADVDGYKKFAEVYFNE